MTILLKNPFFKILIVSFIILYEQQFYKSE
nr:MAG TPA: hypothetical protein [Caudoviricetes sp.]